MCVYGYKLYRVLQGVWTENIPALCFMHGYAHSWNSVGDYNPCEVAGAHNVVLCRNLVTSSC